MSRISDELDRIQFARSLTIELLDTIDPEVWFRMPSEGVTHIAWQVGHLAMAEYRLLLERIRGSRPQDEQLISSEFLTLFGKGSQPTSDAGRYPSAERIRSVFDAVHEQALRELSQTADAVLDEAPEKPHRLFTKKAYALVWCSHHEMIHMGKIGLIRRLLGAEPTW